MDTKKSITNTLKENYMPYAMSVIISRAIPEIDGFKPSHRKILYTMYKMGLLKGARTKSSNVVGQTMRLNPHGDQAIYETLVRLSKGNESLLHPFIDSKGNFGKIYSKDMKYAAPRYTEIKLADIAKELFLSIDKNSVDFVDNYDGTTQEPVLLPVTFPNILVNPNQGIAVGMASNICSFNLNEVADFTIALIDDEETDALDYIKGPDFPTGGQIIYNKHEFKKIINSGRGALKVRAKYVYDKSNSCIEIIEIPYTTTVETIIDKIISLVKSNKIREIVDIRDETDLNGLKITIDIKKSANPDDVMNKLYKLTPLQDTFNTNFNILIDKRPVTLGFIDIIKEWIKFRRGVIVREVEYDIKQKSEKLHLLLGLKKILLDIDLAIKIIRETEKEKDVVPNLMSGFDIDEVQAEFIADIKLRNINKEFILKRIKDVDSLQKEIDDLNGILGSTKRQNNLIKKGLKEVVKKYSQPRKSEIVLADEIDTITHEDLIEDYNVEMFITKFGFLKKIPLRSLRGAGEHKLKNKDKIVLEYSVTNKDELLFFTNLGNLYKLKAYEIEDCKASDFGTHAKHLLGMEDDEEVVFMTTSNDYK